MRNIKKLALALALIFFILTFTSHSIANSSTEASLHERLRIESESNTAYNNILNSFFMHEGDYLYHSNYGGAYLNEAGRLVVLIAVSEDTRLHQHPLNGGMANHLSGEIAIGSKDFDEQSTEFRSAAFALRDLAGTEYGGEVVFQETRYFYSDLVVQMNLFNEACAESMMNPDSIWSQVTAFSLLDDKNCISISILNIDDRKVESFKSEVSHIVDDFDMITFENALDYVHLESFHPGQGFGPSLGIANGSIGYRAERQLNGGTTEKGFVTAGHVVTHGTRVYHASGEFGICTLSQYNSTMDVAFVRVTDHNLMSSTTNSGIAITATAVTPAVNSWVTKDGRSTGLTSGSVTSVITSLPLHYVNMVIQNVIRSNYLSTGGDSGAIVFDNVNRVAGVHIVGTQNGGPGDRYFTAATRILALHSITPY